MDNPVDLLPKALLHILARRSILCRTCQTSRRDLLGLGRTHHSTDTRPSPPHIDTSCDRVEHTEMQDCMGRDTMWHSMLR